MNESFLEEKHISEGRMDDAVQLKRQLITFTEQLFREGFLDEQFNQLQQLQDENNPNFVVEVVSLFFEDSERLLDELAKALDQQNVDFKKVDAHVHQLKGSSSSNQTNSLVKLVVFLKANTENWKTDKTPARIGAQRVQRVCVIFRNYCNDKNVQGCLKCLQVVKNEYALVKNKLETVFNLEQQILAAGGPPSI